MHQPALLLVRSPPPPPPILNFPSFVSPSQLHLGLLHHHHHHSISTITCSCRFPFYITAAAAPLIVAAGKAAVAKEAAEGGEGKPTEEEEEENTQRFIEVGYISKVHGLKGELRIKPTTDFPDLRFSKPGRRWLRARVSGTEVTSEVELTSGRDHPGQKSWIITLRGIDTVDKAKKIVGSTLLVKEGDRPELEEGEFYTHDLVGMRVVLQETNRLVGVVANVFNYGASDLLQVMLNSTEEKVDHSSLSKPDTGASSQVVWVPFVEAIVPEVDMVRREMYITPPKGLLELNLRNDVRSKKERRHLEWKERKKLQQHFLAAKKRLSEMRQDHLLDCLRVGKKAQQSLLRKQMVNINFKLFQHAVQCVNKPSDRFNLSDFIYANSAILQKNTFKTSLEGFVCHAIKEKNELNYRLHKVGLQMLMESKVAIVVLFHGKLNVGKDLETEAIPISTPEAKLRCFQELIVVYKGLLKVEHCINVPLILISPAHDIQSYKELLLDNDFFGLDSQKVWLLEEEKLPKVNMSSDSQKILLKPSYEIIQGPMGSGGVFSVLSSHSMVGKLIEMGVEYIQICSMGERYRPAIVGGPSLFGLVRSRQAEMGITILQGKMEEKDDEFNMVFSVTQLNNICNQIDKLDFVAVAEQCAHMDLVKVGGEYVEQLHSIPDEPNSYRLLSSIWSVALNTCSADGICIMDVSDRFCI